MATLLDVKAAVHRVEALAGEGRYAVTFRVQGGSELGVVAEVRDDALHLAEAGLPAGWSPGSPAHAALTRAVLALHEARATERVSGTLVDVDGGWDVGLGNVVLDDSGAPACVAHGAMVDAGAGRWRCAECGALAGLT